ncbi:MAG TPA: alkane 1-monooxygenase [Polaromonas sp.]|uniref:alkane 1-monooxygenase n=1 Tax=Polaromonas sp. TaxID=1869339 RepID=UPI002D3E0F09|nr:alkane 1-monooxygenase [Polaromonas sp.]HYW55618.1 alkane 1-monooxygenase [Polaromonas sp.]
MRPSDLRFLLAWLLPLLTIVGIFTHPAQSALLTLAVWWGIALLDAFAPGAQRSPAPMPSGASLVYFQTVLRLYVLLQIALIATGAYAAVHGDWLTVMGVAFSVGFVTGSQGITFAHELGHSKSRVDRFCGWLLMSSVCYGHFMVEHYRGHHPRAATQDDPASARLGESLYRFLPRTLWGSLASGWQLEAQRIAQFKSSWLRSPLAWSALGSLMLFVLPALYLPAHTAIKFIAFFALQSTVAFLLLEVVNYIEHYGLRRSSEGGRREAFGVMHAWNADHVVSNSLLANLQRHSDHHMHAWKPYATLQALPGPQLPTGYAGCLLLAMLPPLWFFLMHKRIAALPDAPARLAVHS